MKLVPNYHEHCDKSSYYFVYRTNIFTEYGDGVTTTVFNASSWGWLLERYRLQRYEVN